jgi:ribulose kinase
MSFEAYFIGIDVGTGSARAGIFDAKGGLIASAIREIQTWRTSTDHRIFEQSTSNIWDSICYCVRRSLKEANLKKEVIKGIGFDATCSLAVTDFDGNPITVTSGSTCGTLGERNVILWADHRAEAEAELINKTNSV